MTIKKLKSIDIINVLSDLVSEKLETTVKLPGCIDHNFIENNNDIELEALLDKFNTILLMTNPLKTSKQSR